MVEYKVLKTNNELNELKNFQEIIISDCYGNVHKDSYLPTIKEILKDVKTIDELNQETQHDYSIRLKGKRGIKDAKVYCNMYGDLVLKFCYNK